MDGEEDTARKSFTLGPSKEKELGDWALLDVVAFVELGIGMGLTLNMSGVTVSGEAISTETYFREMANLIKSADNGGNNSSIVKTLHDTYTTFAENEREDQVSSDKALSFSGYIHLRRATFRSTAGGYPDGGMLWRGRITEVSGWAMGQMG